MKSKIQLKICGMRDETNIMGVSTMLPDFMGFIFYTGSKRFVGNEFTISNQLPAQIKRVGVFVDSPVSEVIRLVHKHRLDLVQLHGNESSAECQELQKHVKVIKVFLVDTNFDFEKTEAYQSTCDYFLFDTKSDLLGGSGKVFDWSLLTNYRGNIPFFLSGGLSPENVKEALKLKHSMFAAIDVNSGVESSPGVKDPIKLKLLTDILNSES